MTTLAHHYLTQPRDWHGRWCAPPMCGAVNPHVDGIPRRCYRSKTYGDPSAYLDHLERLLAGDIDCTDVTTALEAARADALAAIDLANELEDLGNSLVAPTATETLTAFGMAVVVSLLGAGLVMAGFALLGPLVAFPAGAGLAMASAFADELLAAISGGALEPPPGAPPPEDLANQFAPFYDQIFQAMQQGQDVMGVVQEQLHNLNIPGIPADVLQAAYVSSLQSFFASRAKYMSDVLQTSLNKLANDCKRLQDNPDYRAKLERRLAKMRARYHKECTGGQG